MSGIFKAYDIRGIYPDQLDEEMARKIGIATGNFFDPGSIVVGHDMREVAEPISENLIQGLLQSGQDVIDIGLCSTPMNYNAIGHFQAEGGVMVTASHNPSEYIGFKLSRDEAKPVAYETGINTIEKNVTKSNLPVSNQEGSIREVDYLETFIESLLEHGTAIDELSIALDTGNGMGGLTVPKVLERLPVNFDGLYLELDGSFPNHIPNPLETKNMQDLQTVVEEGNYDLGMAFDGDGDRVAFVDERGEIVPPDLLTALLVEPNLVESPGSAIVYDLRSSRVVPEEIKKHGGEPVRHRVGHAYMKAKMREVDAVFGGELSGHYYYRKNYYTDCGLLCALDVMTLLSDENKSFSELLEPLRRYEQSGEINFEVDDKQRVMEELADKFEQGEVDWLDGVTVQFDDWWFNVRPSNTEPLLRLNLEVTNRDQLEKRIDQVESIIESYT